MSTGAGAPAHGVLGVDAGSVRVGLAATDDSGTLAVPLITLQRADRRFWERIGEVIRERNAQLAVVGLPLNLDGGEGSAAQLARDFARDLTLRTGCDVELFDERFTSVQAERSLLESGMRRSARRQRVDMVAATLLLQSWLDRRSRNAHR